MIDLEQPLRIAGTDIEVEFLPNAWPSSMFFTAKLPDDYVFFWPYLDIEVDEDGEDVEILQQEENSGGSWSFHIDGGALCVDEGLDSPFYLENFERKPLNKLTHIGLED